MKELRTLHVYGQTAIQSQFCAKCQQEAFVVSGKLTCCGTKVETQDPNIIRVEVDLVGSRRKRPSVYQQREILESQQNKCAYCDAEFGSYRWFNGKAKRVTINWDHRVPFSYNGNNAEFVAACSDCNAAKSNLHFFSMSEAREHLQLRLYERQKPSRKNVS